MKKVSPEFELVEIPIDHPIDHQKFDFQNGWEDPRIRNDPEEKRQQGLRMGALIAYCFTNSFICRQSLELLGCRLQEKLAHA